MVTICCKNSDKGVTFMPNADGMGRIMAVATQDGEYWFSLGWYKTEAGAKRAAAKQMAAHNYEFDAVQLADLKING